MWLRCFTAINNIYNYIHVFIYIYIYICMYLYIHVHVTIFMYLFICIFIFIYVYVYIYIKYVHQWYEYMLSVSYGGDRARTGTPACERYPHRSCAGPVSIEPALPVT